MILTAFFHFLVFLLLTVLTQIGGLIYCLVLFLKNRGLFKTKKMASGAFLVIYLIFTLLIVPIVAPFFGREKVIITDGIRPANVVTVLLNRNYVRPQLNDLLLETAKELKASDDQIEIRFLDANFPFINHFPLLPHLSHNDGKKLDLSFVYENTQGQLTNKKKSISGYGVFAVPKEGERNQNDRCKSAGYWQYDFTKYLTFGRINKEIKFSIKGTKRLVKALLKNKSLGKLFIEPHLKKRMSLSSSRIRFHGCRAVRHDDHIHIQLK